MGRLVTICGPPLSGKSTVAAHIALRLQEDGDAAKGHGTELSSMVKVVMVRDAFERDSWRRKRTFSSSHTEKNARAMIKESVERGVQNVPNMVLICDSLNYIKGFRYELFCIARSHQVPHCVVHCVEHNVENALQRNRARRDEHEQYDEDAMRALYARFEAPIGTNRWDAPLFELDVADPDWRDSLAMRALLEFCLEGRQNTLPVNKATVKQKLSGANMLAELDTASRRVESTLIEHLMQGEASVSIPLDSAGGAVAQVRIGRDTNAAELRQIRRAYIKLARLNPPDDALGTDDLVKMYCEHLNRLLAAGCA